MLKPLGENVVIQVPEAEEVTKGGIVLPSSQQEKQKFGDVVAVGPEVEENGNIKVGDSVLFKPYAGSDVEVDGEEYLIVKEEEILAIIEK